MEIKIPFKVSPQTAEDLKNNLPFASADIESFEVDVANSVVRIQLKAGADVEKVQTNVNRLIEKVKPSREGDLSMTLFDQSQLKIKNSNPVFPILMERGDLLEVSPGYFALSGQFMDLYQTLDKKLKAFSKDFGAQEIVLPVTTTIDTLKKINFFKKTPQFANFVSLLKSDMDVIADFAKNIDNKDFEFSDHLQSPKTMCRSAICLNSYQLHQNKNLTKESFQTFSVFGKAFRNEEKNVTSLERLHEFSMREFIFFGDKEYVAKGLEKCKDWFQNYLEVAELKSQITTASDPFFADALQSLQFFQFAEQSKVEIQVYNPETNNYVAVGSLNNHANHFSSPYSIQAESKEAYTGCVGFGYERILFTTLAQHGLNYEVWPEKLKQFWEL